MKIALCNGGLGNQTFQYIFSRFVELEGGAPCYLDNAAFCGQQVEHNGYELSRVFPNAKPRLLSSCFTEDVWQYMVEKGGIAQQLRDAGEDYVMVAETGDFKFDGNVIPVPCNDFCPWVAHANGNIYYHGYWINSGWLKKGYWNVLQRELSFGPLKGEHNKRYEEEIERTNSVAMHIRRGDFITFGAHASIEMCRSAVLDIKEKLTAPHFFVFSDDLDWCRQNGERMGLQPKEVTFAEGNRGSDSYLDMQLMSYCKNVVLVVQSSFSYLATLLNRNDAVFVYNMTSRPI